VTWSKLGGKLEQVHCTTVASTGQIPPDIPLSTRKTLFIHVGACKGPETLTKNAYWQDPKIAEA
jgi:hypothetical protein